MTLAQPMDFECHSKGFYNDFHSILYNRRILRHFANENLSSFIIPNSPESLISQSSKLLQLDRLLKDLKKKQWRVLIFCQMTKMLDILEEYMIHRGYTYFRMDGQCQINDRRDMVNEFQQNDKIFAFLLSTRAGGLGITLTQADAVIFYDNDWNPTMDAQATDRAHRIGRTKDVYVYRLVTKGTIEERIVKRAQQKQNVQSTVYSGGFQGDKFKPQEVFELLFDEQEMDDTVTNKFIQKGQKKKKKAPKQQDQNQEEEDIIEVDLNILEQNEKDIEDAD
ncbi:putative DNA helicase ino80 [Paramecium bursaria]